MLHKVDIRGWEANTAWCVPTAISYLTGIPLIHSHSRAAFVQNMSLNKVSGVFASEAILMLREQGYKSKQIDLIERFEDAPTLKKFLKCRSSYEKCMPLMVQIEDENDFCHMSVVHFDYVADNWTMKPVPSEKFPHLRKKVVSAWVIEKR